MADDEITKPLERSYLDRILLHLADRDPDDRILKTYLDSWFAHSRGGGLIEASGRPQWMNRGDLKRQPSRCNEAHAISLAAAAALEKGDVSDLVRDHTIPKAIIVIELKRRRWQSLCQLHTFLRLWYTVTILLQVEHRTLAFKSTMPGMCTDAILADDPGARFARDQRPGAAIPIRLLPLAYDSWPKIHAFCAPD